MKFKNFETKAVFDFVAANNDLDKAWYDAAWTELNEFYSCRELEQNPKEAAIYSLMNEFAESFDAQFTFLNDDDPAKEFMVNMFEILMSKVDWEALARIWVENVLDNQPEVMNGR